MKYGLTKEHWNFLEKNLLDQIRQFKSKMYLFGSRAKGTQHPFSDIDILVDDTVSSLTAINKTEIFARLEEIENSNFPYKIDLVYVSDLAKSYIEDVQKTKIEL